MDGGRRLPRPVDFLAWRPRLAGLPALATAPANLPQLAGRAPGRNLPALVRRRESAALPPGSLARLSAFAARPGAGLLVSALVLGGAGLAGALRGGQYDAFVAANGSLADVAARALGFGISAVVITTDNGMPNESVLNASGVDAHSSLLFVNAAQVRERLKAVPLVREASVRKLYPDRLVIDIEERQPFALWQRDGRIAVVSADGTPIDEMRDARFAELPFVVGEGANLRAAEYAGLLEAAGELRPRIRAGVMVSGRRWDLKMDNGLDVKLPEREPGAAVAALAQLERDSRVLEKDVVFLDFRTPGRMVARLTEEGADTRAAQRPARRARPGQT